ncbi:MAG: tRNA-wybutosine modification methyltransferase TYW3 [Candidatus Anstonellales archaeon]
MEWKKFKEQKISELKRAEANGEVDEEILDLVCAINEKNGCVTSSSCAGRILLLEGTSKGDAKHYKKWHSLPAKKEIENAIKNYEGKKILWLRVEPFILHVFAKDLDSAMEFMRRAKNAGVKRGGIQYSKNFYFIEIQGTAGLNMPANVCSCDWEKIYRIMKRMFEENGRRRGILKKQMLKN